MPGRVNHLHGPALYVTSCSLLSWKEEEGDISTSPDVSEFVSDAFDSCAINQEDLRKDMEQLVLVKRTDANTQEGQL